MQAPASEVFQLLGADTVGGRVASGGFTAMGLPSLDPQCQKPHLHWPRLR